MPIILILTSLALTLYIGFLRFQLRVATLKMVSINAYVIMFGQEQHFRQY